MTIKHIIPIVVIPILLDFQLRLITAVNKPNKNIVFITNIYPLKSILYDQVSILFELHP